MITQWCVLVEACGIPTRNLSPLQVFEYSQRIISDSVLFSKVIAAHDKSDTRIRRGERETAISKLTAAERADLRDRVLEVRRIKK